MPAVTVDDITVLPRVPLPDPALARQRAVRGVTTAPGGFEGELDSTVYDEVVDVRDDLAYATTRDLARREALLVGASSGGVAAAALQVAAREDCAGKLVVAVLFDSGERYLSTPLFTDVAPPSVDDLGALLG